MPYYYYFYSKVTMELTQCNIVQIDKSIGAMQRRLQKTLTSDELFPSLWDKCKVSHLIFLW